LVEVSHKYLKSKRGVYNEKQDKGILGAEGTFLPHERLELSAGISGSFPEYDRET
jgi:hypothetical protein